MCPSRITHISPAHPRTRPSARRCTACAISLYIPAAAAASSATLLLNVSPERRNLSRPGQQTSLRAGFWVVLMVDNHCEGDDGVERVDVCRDRSSLDGCGTDTHPSADSYAQTENENCACHYTYADMPKSVRCHRACRIASHVTSCHDPTGPGSDADTSPCSALSPTFHLPFLARLGEQDKRESAADATIQRSYRYAPAGDDRGDEEDDSVEL
ncbi:uncharacterized protein K489DRAFT_130964 [Dissoconium aciculare CBS 342.82]|uniref:Uncharacterized protein n=1 Tax=Dissoconium aciculare CBS 342.82 TaxID=1314786 RepID=A0A6J3LQQ4_9PEZI|nr:uncharacterized protein K489DRAFT_130964 [Dissoconium aciculare CBS 342.82]KAF1818211.1 hypothetical protein K489DRAFT_130964 [Dissoconium aciculare CBS 342.82]